MRTASEIRGRVTSPGLLDRRRRTRAVQGVWPDWGVVTAEFGLWMEKTDLPSPQDKAFMGRLLTWLFAAFVLVYCTRTSAADSGPHLALPADDLPSTVIGAYRVDFTRNGAFVVSKDGHCLFDGGLVYANPDWSEWGTQIRRSDDADSWEPDAVQKATKLLVRGTLSDFNRNARFTFVEGVEVVPGGLRLSYRVTPSAKRDIGAFGVALHFPVAETVGAKAVFSPGFGSAPMPEVLGQASLYTGPARVATVLVSDEPRVMVAASGTVGWTLLDYRTWGVNAYWLIGADYGAAQALGRGETASFSFNVWLGRAAGREVALGTARCKVNPYAGLSVDALDGRIVEGGLAFDGENLTWLHSTAIAEAPGAAADALATAQRASPVPSGVPIRYDVKLTPEPDGAVVATYRIRGNGRYQRGFPR